MTAQSDDLTQRLEACFRAIETERMEGIPILNPALAVKAIGMRAWQDRWLCVLVTPWFINLMLLPGAQGEASKDEAPVRAGTKKSFAFPAGQFEFIRGHEDAIGDYWACSLFSPVLEFSDQDTAIATAEAAIEAIFADAEEASDQEQEMTMIWEGRLPEAESETASGQAAQLAQTTEPEAFAGAEAEKLSTTSKQENLSRRAFLRGTIKEAEA